VYAVSLTVDGERYRGMLNIKAFKESQVPSVQVHLFDYDSNFNLRGKEATITFHKRMRDELRLESTQGLKLQLEKDKEEIEALIY
jgi:riboflavin kinase/FMN adenylyltransferase